jgi:hypothetical protein
MRKIYIIIVLVFVIVSSTIINIGITPPVTRADTGYCPPQISATQATPQTVGFGNDVIITATVSDSQSGVYYVNVNITSPNAPHVNQTLTHKEGTTYEYTFTDTWRHGWYNYTIYATGFGTELTRSHSYHKNIM